MSAIKEQIWLDIFMRCQKIMFTIFISCYKSTPYIGVFLQKFDRDSSVPRKSGCYYKVSIDRFDCITILNATCHAMSSNLAEVS